MKGLRFFSDLQDCFQPAFLIDFDSLILFETSCYTTVPF